MMSHSNKPFLQKTFYISSDTYTVSLYHGKPPVIDKYDTLIVQGSAHGINVVIVKKGSAPLPPVPDPTPVPTPTPTPTPSPIPVKFVADVVNHSSKLSISQLQTICNAVKIQLDRDGAPYWGSTAEFNFGPPVTGHAKLGVFDNADQPGALGWHDDVNNQVTIEIFYIGTLADVAVTISHEMLETIGDYNASTTVQGTDPNGKACTFYTENCDPVESDVYQINGISVSDFATPAWFKLPQPAGTPDGRFDFMKKTTKPFELSRGGYMEISYDGGRTWSEIQARTSGMDKFSGSHKRR